MQVTSVCSVSLDMDLRGDGEHDPGFRCTLLHYACGGEAVVIGRVYWGCIAMAVSWLRILCALCRLLITARVVGGVDAPSPLLLMWRCRLPNCRMALPKYAGTVEPQSASLTRAQTYCGPRPLCTSWPTPPLPSSTLTASQDDSRNRSAPALSWPGPARYPSARL